MKIYINPGHSNNPDTGNTEKNINKTIADKLMKYLRDSNHEVASLYFLNPNDVPNSSNSYDVDIFLCLECNASSNITDSGIETIIYNGSTEGMLLASCINYHIAATIPVHSHGIKSISNNVLRNTKAYAAIVKLGYITNEHDVRMLTNEQFQDKFARAIANGINAYIAAK